MKSNLKRISNQIVKGKHNKDILFDVVYKQNGIAKPIIFFAHGFKGFKDWGHFNVVANEFAMANYVFVKFNFSHNGTDHNNLTEFVDLAAFGNNNFSIELDDLGTVMDYLLGGNAAIELAEFNNSNVNLIGHSRGGGITILKAAEDARVSKIITWASVNEFGRYWDTETFAKWEKDGVHYVKNGRTGQQMPLYWQLYENYFANQSRLHIPTAVKNLSIPFLAIHGDDDGAVPHSLAIEMAGWNNNIQLEILENANHVFGGKHPWEEENLPNDMQKVVDLTLSFLQQAT